MKRSVMWIVMLAVPLTVGAVAWAAGDKADDKATPNAGARQDATKVCSDMMQGQGVTEEGMGNGDVMLGMTRMMEMMDGEGGMMGGDGTMQPGSRK